MAGKVLRSSNGRYAGSTRGWGKGRSTHGGGFGDRKGKTKRLRPKSALVTRQRVQAGVSVGLAVGGALASRKLVLAGARSGSKSLIVAGAAAGIASRVAFANGGKVAVQGAIKSSRKRIGR